MANQLEQVLTEAKSQIGGALASARAELDDLNVRRRYLEALIAQAELLQASPGESARTESTYMTLHEAIAIILREQGNRWMTARELADCVNDHGLYHKKDGSPVETNQIHARTKNYDRMFEKHDSKIRLLLATEGE